MIKVAVKSQVVDHKIKSMVDKAVSCTVCDPGRIAYIHCEIAFSCHAHCHRPARPSVRGPCVIAIHCESSILGVGRTVNRDARVP